MLVKAASEGVSGEVSSSLVLPRHLNLPASSALQHHCYARFPVHTRVESVRRWHFYAREFDQRNGLQLIPGRHGEGH